MECSGSFGRQNVGVRRSTVTCTSEGSEQSRIDDISSSSRTRLGQGRKYRWRKQPGGGSRREEGRGNVEGMGDEEFARELILFLREEGIDTVALPALKEFEEKER